MTIAGVVNGQTLHDPLLPALCATVLFAQSRPRAAKIRRESRAEFAEILAGIEQRDGERAREQ